jgi:hypothetical protein
MQLYALWQKLILRPAILVQRSNWLGYIVLFQTAMIFINNTEIN